MPAHVWIAGVDDTYAVAALLMGLRAAVAELLHDPATDYLLGAADQDGAACGVCQLRYRLSVWTGSDDCWLEDLYVRDEARRSGVGRALVAAAVARARARGCRRIELASTSKTRERSRSTGASGSARSRSRRARRCSSRGGSNLN